jgi:hypothetical protein
VLATQVFGLFSLRRVLAVRHGWPVLLATQVFGLFSLRRGLNEYLIPFVLLATQVLGPFSLRREQIGAMLETFLQTFPQTEIYQGYDG